MRHWRHLRFLQRWWHQPNHDLPTSGNHHPGLQWKWYGGTLRAVWRERLHGPDDVRESVYVYVLECVLLAVFVAED